MGLGVYANDERVWSASYSTFGDFRRAILEAAPDYVPIPTSELTDERIQGFWLHQPDDALAFLIEHSDCDGVILPYDAGRLADRLEGLREAVSADWRDDIDAWVSGLREASATKTIVEFL